MSDDMSEELGEPFTPTGVKPKAVRATRASDWKSGAMLDNLELLSLEPISAPGWLIRMYGMGRVLYVQTS
jgi:hypothetical protein